MIMVAEMSMIGWICGHTRRDRIRNDVGSRGEPPIHLCGDVRRYIYGRLEKEEENQRRTGARSLDKHLQLTKNVAIDRKLWRSKIMVEDLG